MSNAGKNWPERMPSIRHNLANTADRQILDSDKKKPEKTLPIGLKDYSFPLPFCISALLLRSLMCSTLNAKCYNIQDSNCPAKTGEISKAGKKLPRGMP